MTAPTDTPAVSEREELIEYFEGASTKPWRDDHGTQLITISLGRAHQARAALASSEAEVERLKGELAEAGQYTEAHERLDDLARERVADAEARVAEAVEVLWEIATTSASLEPGSIWAALDDVRNLAAAFLAKLHSLRKEVEDPGRPVPPHGSGP